MAAFDWREEYSVGIKEIDDQHKGLFATISELNDAVVGKSVKLERLNEIFDRLNDYVETHFTTEERYFSKFHYPKTEEHVAAHKFFANNVKSMQKRVDQDIHELSLELVAFLEFWLVGHVMVMDKEYTECFHEHGLK